MWGGILLTPAPTDHLAGRAADVDFEVWLDTGDTPCRNDSGGMHLQERRGRAAVSGRGSSDWNLNPDVSTVDLAFNPPDGAQRIPFLVRVRQPAAAQSSTTGEVSPDKAQPISGQRRRAIRKDHRNEDPIGKDRRP